MRQSPPSCSETTLREHPPEPFRPAIAAAPTRGGLTGDRSSAGGSGRAGPGRVAWPPLLDFDDFGYHVGPEGCGLGSKPLEWLYFRLDQQDQFLRNRSCHTAMAGTQLDIVVAAMSHVVEVGQGEVGCHIFEARGSNLVVGRRGWYVLVSRPGRDCIRKPGLSRRAPCGQGSPDPAG